MESIYDFEVQTADDLNESLSKYQGQVLLIVNTASKCGFTPQYAGLEALQQKFANDGFCVLAFPCNQFAGQEPGSNEEIQSFCQTNYHITFPVYGKLKVNGKDAHALYQYLTTAAKGILGSEAIKWNFTKFLIDSAGHVVKRYAPKDAPEHIEADIQTLLNPV